jgi:NFU1 iron-sulfur cluster scaffold homolog, mitochondrial
MYIEVTDTPNPNTMKFNPGIQVLEKGIMSFTSLEEATDSPLAKSVLKIPGVSAIFLSEEFITVTKDPQENWEYLKPIVLAELLDHFASGFPVIENANKVDALSNDNEVVKKIKNILEERVRPAVAMDGGDIVFNHFKDGIVYVELHGACSGCPSSTVTLKNGVENMLKHYVPEVESVEAI